MAKMDFFLNDVYDEVTTRNLQSFELLLDTVDYVPPRFLRKFQKDIFKLYKKQRRQSKAEARRLRKLPEQEPIAPPQEDSEPPKVITAELMQIDDTTQAEALTVNIVKQLAELQRKFPELVEKIFERHEDDFDPSPP